MTSSSAPPLRDDLNAEPDLKMPVMPNHRAMLNGAEASVILKRFYFLQRECVLAQAGWLPGTLHWETKLLWPEWIWQDSLVASELRSRVLELRHPETELSPGKDESLLGLWRQILRDAPNDVAFAQALSMVIKPFLSDLFRLYLQLTESLHDAPTVRVLQQAMRDIDEQGERTKMAQSTVELVYRVGELHLAKDWAMNVRQALQAIGTANFLHPIPPPVLPPLTGRIPFQLSRTGRRDPRFISAWASWPDLLDPSHREGESPLEAQVRHAQEQLNHLWSAEMVAAVICDLADEAPSEFLTETARCCFDRIRLCRMGHARFLEWGFKMSEMPMGSFSYDLGAPLDSISRLGLIVSDSIPDIEKWIAFFAASGKHELTVQEMETNVAEARIQAQASATDAMRQRTEEIRVKTLQRARQLARLGLNQR